MNEIEHESVIDIDKLAHANTVFSDWHIVNANNRLDVNFIDINNFFQRFVDMNDIEHKSVIDIDKLVHNNKY